MFSGWICFGFEVNSGCTSPVSLCGHSLGASYRFGVWKYKCSTCAHCYRHGLIAQAGSWKYLCNLSFSTTAWQENRAEQTWSHLFLCVYRVICTDALQITGKTDMTVALLGILLIWSCAHFVALLLWILFAEVLLTWHSQLLRARCRSWCLLSNTLLNRFMTCMPSVSTGLYALL